MTRPLAEELTLQCGCGAPMEPMIAGANEVLWGCTNDKCVPGQVNTSRVDEAQAVDDPHELSEPRKGKRPSDV